MWHEKLRTLDLFSGIGGFSLGLERTGGFETVAFCEIDSFCRKVLAKHWPHVPIFEDITKLTEKELDGIGRIDVICGGFPCQPVSCAGKRKGKEDERWLWSEFYRVVCEVKPRWVLVENVPGLLSADSGRLFAGILRDLAASGYDAEWNIISAASVGAPHLRKRVFVIARQMADTGCERLERPKLFKRDLNVCKCTSNKGGWAVEPELGRTLDGLSTWLDGNRRVMLISHKRLIAYGVDENSTSEKPGPGEVLRVLRDAIREEILQREIGGFSGISAEEVLLTYLCKLSEASEALDNLSLESKEAQKDILRGMWPQKEPASAPYRSNARKQRSGEHPDTLQALSRLLAHDSQKAWAEYRRENATTILNPWGDGWENGIPRVANGIPSRVDRLRALGNAIVPQCSEFVGRCVLEAI